jgi:hypothetical protein
VKCLDYQLVPNSSRLYAITETTRLYRFSELEYNLCDSTKGIQTIRNYTGPHNMNCSTIPKTFNNRSYQVSFHCQTRCVSKYRVRDGVRDCFLDDELTTINNSCSQIQRHRLQCSPSELTCLLVGALGNYVPDCSNGQDEFDEKSDIVLFQNIVCKKNNAPECVYLREYIQTSSENKTNIVTIVEDSSTTIPFRSYCNSFFDTTSAVDESAEFCEKWICLRDEYQCLSGQCISPDWICDGKLIILLIVWICFYSRIFAGEWDCSDGSDEERLFIMDHLNEHNSKLKNLTELKQRCHQQYHSNNTPFSDICDMRFEYPCFRTGIDDPLNIKLYRPCINLTQIGDGKTDCLTGLDERNRLQCSSRGMLGFNIQHNNSLCVTYNILCTNSYQRNSITNVGYDAVCFYRRNVSKNGLLNNCQGLKDVMCINDTLYKRRKM